MAKPEGIKEALSALQEECTWALNLAECFVSAAGDQGRSEPPWVSQFQRSVSRLAVRADALAEAINHES